MRPIPLLLTVVALAPVATGASANLSLPIDREIGTLTCSIAAEPALGTRSETAAECVFMSDRDDAGQAYAAQVRWQRAGSLPPGQARIAWRVLTRKGVERPGMLSGAYANPATWQVAPPRAAVPILMGPMAKLRRMTVVGAATVVEPRPVVEIELTPVSAVAAR